MAIVHPTRITICGFAELARYSAAGFAHVVSILDPGVPAPAEFASFAKHRHLELRFHDVIEEGADVECPRTEHIRRLLSFARDIPAHAPLLIHCHAGFSRSPASAILILAQARPELSAGDIVSELLRIRSNVWPNLRMIEVGDKLLGRSDEIIRAVCNIYRNQLVRQPMFAQLMREVGRTRELEATQS